VNKMTKNERELSGLQVAERELNDLATMALTSIKHFKQAIVNNQIGSPVDPDDAEDVKRKKPKAEKEGKLVIQPARGLLVPSSAGPHDLSISKGEYTAGKGWVHKTEGNLDSAYKGKVSEFFFGPNPGDDTAEKGMGDLSGLMGMPGLNEKDPDAKAVVHTMTELMEQLQQTIKVLQQQEMTQRVPQEVAHTPMDMREGNNRKQPNMPDNRE
tara:strand:- start:626 stop:1261 length:636 start_codon:yes stop_codon:yes gene_type:complete